MRHLVHFKASRVNCLILAFFALAACTKEQKTPVGELSQTKAESSKVATAWMRLGAEITPEIPGYTSPVAARTFAYLGIGLYEAVAQGIEGQPSLQGRLEGLAHQSLPAVYEGGPLNWSVVVNECMHYLFGKFYKNAPPATSQQIDQLYHTFRDELSLRSKAEVVEKSVLFGSMMGKAIYNYSVSDGQDEAFLYNYPREYSIPQGLGLWSPTSNQIRRPLQPYWGDVRTFLSVADATEMPTPPAFSTEATSPFYASALDVRNRVRNLDESIETVVKFWNDDQDHALTMAGHMITILSDLLESNSADLEFAAQAYAKMGICLHDATVASWKVKYRYNILRPETYIREHIDANFLPLIDPQATPEYSSSSSAVGSACAEVFSQLFGYQYAFTDRTHEFRKDIDGSPRSYQSFQQMSEEISTACLYGGIHYRFSLEAGKLQGSTIGSKVARLKI